MQIYDSQQYEDSEVLPDLGSLICINQTGNKREYRLEYTQYITLSSQNHNQPKYKFQRGRIDN